MAESLTARHQGRGGSSRCRLADGCVAGRMLVTRGRSRPWHNHPHALRPCRCRPGIRHSQLKSALWLSPWLRPRRTLCFLLVGGAPWPPLCFQGRATACEEEPEAIPAGRVKAPAAPALCELRRVMRPETPFIRPTRSPGPMAGQEPIGLRRSRQSGEWCTAVTSRRPRGSWRGHLALALSVRRTVDARALTPSPRCGDFAHHVRAAGIARCAVHGCRVEAAPQCHSRAGGNPPGRQHP